MKGACFECRYFDRHNEVIRGPFWSDEWIEVPGIGGDCRLNPPTVTWTGSRFPYVTTGQSCGQFSPLNPKPEGEG